MNNVSGEAPLLKVDFSKGSGSESYYFDVLIPEDVSLSYKTPSRFLWKVIKSF